MRILGVLAVVGACLGIGLSRVRTVRREIRSLEALTLGIQVMRAELSCRLCPMQELLLQAAERTDAQVGGFFSQCAERLTELNTKSFYEIWSEACRSCLISLSEDNLRQLEKLGTSLGRYEPEEQLAACDRYLRCCEGAAEKLRVQLPEQRRLSLALGAAAGVFLCLLIL